MATNDPTDTDGDATGLEPIEEPDRIDGDCTVPFAGLTRHNEDVAAVGLPEQTDDHTSSMGAWAIENASGFDRENDAANRDLPPEVLPERGLNTLIPELPRAALADVEWVHPSTGETLRTEKHNAVYNPERVDNVDTDYLAEQVADETGVDYSTVRTLIDNHGAREAIDRAFVDDTAKQGFLEDVMLPDDALFNIPTDDYTIINPQDFLPALVEELRDREWGDKVFGQVKLERDGGRASLDVYFDGQHVEAPTFADDREPVVVGLQIQWDFFGDWAVRMCGQALDWSCVNHIHRMTGTEIVKHAGDVESRQDWREWFSQGLDKLEEKRDHLREVIQQASEAVLDISELPDDIQAEYREKDAATWTALYAYMDLPDYLAEQAGRRLRSRAEDPYEPTWWDIHSAATYALSHHARGSRGMDNAYDQYARRANDMLMNPATMEDRIVRNYEADREDDQSRLAEEGGGKAEIQAAFEDVAEKKETFEERRAELEEMGVEV